MRIAAVAVACWLAAAGAQAADLSGPVKTGAADLDALVADPANGLAIANLPATAASPIVAVRRTATGEAEVHEGLNDTFVVRAGRARVLVGGQVTGGRRTAPGEWRGGTITGAETFEVAPGDLLWIPAGVPHQVVLPPGGDFTYLAVKSPK